MHHYSYADPNSHTNPNTYADTYAYTNSQPHAHANPYSDSLMMDSNRIQRERAASLESYRDRLRSGAGEGNCTMAVSVIDNGDMPTGPLKTYFTNPINGFDFDDMEGAAPSADISGEIVPVVFLGGTPAVGDQAIAYSVGGRWVAEMGAAGESGDGEGSGCNVNVCVQTCDSTPTPVAGVLVVITGAPTPGPLDAQCTTTFSGGGTPESPAPGANACCVINVVEAGTYTVSVTAEGFYPYVNQFAFTCGPGVDNTDTINLLAIAGNPPVFQFTVTGVCGQPLPGATVTIGGATQTTDASGMTTGGPTEAGTYAWSVSKERFVAQSGTVTITKCQPGGANIGVTLAIASGFAPAPCLTGAPSIILADPVPNPLTLTDSVYGEVSFNWTAGGAGPFGQNWNGTNPSGSYPGGPSPSPFEPGPNLECPPLDIPITYSLPDCTQACAGSVSINTLSDPTTACPSNVANGGRGGGLSIGVASSTSTLSPAIPFDWVMTVPTFSPGVGSTMYPSGGTITISE